MSARPGQFVGRVPELKLLREMLAGAQSHQPAVALIRGEAGVGKTRLLAEFSSQVQPGRILSGTCLPMGERGLPFGPIIETLRALGADPELRERVPAGVDALLFAGNKDRTGTVHSRSQLFQAVLDLVEDLARTDAVVLIIEDLHWADQSTRDLLTFLVPNLRSQRVLVIGTYRTDYMGRDHPLRPVLAELARHPIVHGVDVPPFDAGQVAEQLEHLTGRLPDRHTVDTVVSRTQGNAYFVEELVAAGRLRGGRLPQSLRELLLVRADVVSPAARETMRVASLVAGQVDDQLLAAVTGRPVVEIRNHLHEAIDAQLLVTTEHGVRFRHSLLQEALQQDLLASERAECHRAFAGVLDGRVDKSRAARAETTAQLAFHAHQGGDIEKALTAWINAAGAAEAVLAHAEAHQHLANAVAVWDGVDDPETLTGMARVDVLARAGEAAFLAGDADSACDFTRQAIDLVDMGVDSRAGGILYERLSRYLRDTADRDRSAEMIERAVKLVPADPPSVERAGVLAGQARQLMYQGRFGRAKTVSERAVDMARAVGSIAVESDALNTLGAVNWYVADDVLGLQQIEAALTLAESVGDSHQQMRSHWNLGVCHAEAGRREESVRLKRRAIEVLPRLGHQHMLPEIYRFLADDLVCLGRWDDARAVVDEAARRFPERSDEATSIQLAIGQGELASARRLIAAASERDIFRALENRILVVVHLADLETWEGNLDAARIAVDRALGLLADHERPASAARALNAALRCDADAAHEARMQSDQSALELARERGRGHVRLLRSLLDKPGPTGGWKREARAIAATCEAEATRLEGGSDPDRWGVAIAVSDELSMAYAAAYAKVRRGEALVGANGDRTEAAGLISDAYDAAVTMGAKPLQRLIERVARRARVGLGSVDADPFGLTPREREVLDLVADGATNRQISEELYISEKTASVHVSNIIRKLSVTNRGQVAAVAFRAGLVHD